mmetsp:Transcript_99887/g.287001  ORF Transcript_99887/g.287001 Transcript_99887/m.287001 type:complete len:1585 (+) Transcript_99887:104-4858(+)
MEHRRENEILDASAAPAVGQVSVRRTTSTEMRPERRHKSLQMMRSRLSSSLAQVTSAVRGIGGGAKPKKQKHSLSGWGRYATVSFPAEESKDWAHTSERLAAARCCARVWTYFVPWLLPGLIGFLTASSGVLIEKASERLNGLLFGYCSLGPLALAPAECREAGGWTSWSDVTCLTMPAFLGGYAAYVAFAVVLAASSAALVQHFAPTARGSGIPEVKTILGGFVMAEVLEFKTLVVKVIGLALSVSSGMALGKEGPLVHVACCWANACSKLSPRYMENEGKRRELISTAAAAGVAVAFGAPVGGVLFSYEEVSTMFPQKTMIRAFFAASIAALTLLWYNPTGTGKLTMFEAYTPEMPSISEYPWFVLLGVLGGVFGARFVKWNVQISAGRRDGSAFRNRMSIVAEVAGIAMITAITSYPSPYTRALSTTTIRALFHSCEDAHSARPEMFGLCNGQAEPSTDCGLVGALLLASLVRFLQMTITFGTGVPCGLFVPSLYCGACLGRCLGIFVRTTGLAGVAPVHPEVYAMVGAAAMLGGVCRVTISLVVIMYELTSALQLIVPFMLAVLTAKWVGDSFTHGIYDDYIRLRGYPYLHEPDDFTFGTRACDIMDEDLVCMYADAGTVKEVLAKVRDCGFGGLPVVKSETDRTLVGYVHAKQVQGHLETLLGTGSVFNEDMRVAFGRGKGHKAEAVLDLSKFVDETILRIVPETPLAQVHNIFRQLGIKVVLVARFAELAGLITKKSFVHHLETGHIGHITHDPAVQGAVVDEMPTPEAANGAGAGGGGCRQRRTAHAAAGVRFNDEVESRDIAHAVPRAARQSESRRSSLRAMRDTFIAAFSRSPKTHLKANSSADTESTDSDGFGSSPAKEKKSLNKWTDFSTVSWRADDMKDYEEHVSVVLKKGSRLERLLLAGLPWLIPAIVGVLTATSGSLIEVAAERVNLWRFGRCTTNIFAGREECGDAWLPWATEQSYAMAYYAAVSTVLATGSALLVWAFAPTARGSGIPEVKTILGGFVMKDVLDFKTLAVKVVGLTMSVSSGMSLGKEGPLVHVACCWANVCSRWSARYVENEAKRRELISTAAAAGVSVAFGTPLGGVLFSYEEVSTMFPQKTMVRAFFAAVVAALTLRWWDPTGTGKLTMFETHFAGMPSLAEYPLFFVLGVVGGMLGALFVHNNIAVSAGRRDGTPFRRRIHIILEVAVIAFVTAITSFPSTFARGMSTVTIRSLFQGCATAPEGIDMMGLCKDGEDVLGPELMQALLFAGLLRYVQMTFTFGTGVPCGLFVPSLFSGACVGRCLGIIINMFNTTYPAFALGVVNPGVYAMVGAAAVLGGVCRVTISLVVIMFGLTGALQLIVPFMIAILTAKLTGDLFGDGIYDAYIVLRGYPYLHEPHDVSFKARACDIMDDQLECLVAEPTTVGELLKTLKESTHGGFPLVASHEDHTLLGYVHAMPLRKHLEASLSTFVAEDVRVAFRRYTRVKASGAMDLSKFVDETVVRIVPETPLAQVHNIFRQLGVKLVLVARFGSLAGLITKKSFVDHLLEGHVGHVAHDPAVGRVAPQAAGAGEAAREPAAPGVGGVTQPLLEP